MKLVIQSTDVRIAINPKQNATLTKALPQLKLKWPSLEHVAIVEDESIAPGGCRISAGQGKVDASLDTQIDRIASELLPTAQDMQAKACTPIGVQASACMSSLTSAKGET